MVYLLYEGRMGATQCLCGTITTLKILIIPQQQQACLGAGGPIVVRRGPSVGHREPQGPWDHLREPWGPYFPLGMGSLGAQAPPLGPGAGLLLLRDDKDFQSWDSGTQTLCGPYTADIQSLYSEYTGCADWRMPDFGGKS